MRDAADQGLVSRRGEAGPPDLEWSRPPVRSTGSSGKARTWRVWEADAGGGCELASGAREACSSRVC